MPFSNQSIEEVFAEVDAAGFWSDARRYNEASRYAVPYATQEEELRMLHAFASAASGTDNVSGAASCTGAECKHIYYPKDTPLDGGKMKATQTVSICSVCHNEHVCVSLNSHGQCSAAFQTPRGEGYFCPRTNRYLGPVISEFSFSDCFSGKRDDPDVSRLVPARRRPDAILRAVKSRIQRSPRNRRTKFISTRRPSAFFPYAMTLINALVYHSDNEKFVDEVVRRIQRADNACGAYAASCLARNRPINIVHQARLFVSKVAFYMSVRPADEKDYNEKSSWLAHILISAWRHFVQHIYEGVCKRNPDSQFTFQRIAIAVLYSLPNGRIHRTYLPFSKREVEFFTIPKIEWLTSLPPENMITFFAPQSGTGHMAITPRNISAGLKALNTIMFSYTDYISKQSSTDDEYMEYLKDLEFKLPPPDAALSIE